MKNPKVYAVALAVVLCLAAGVFAVSNLTTKSVAKTAAAGCCAYASCCADGKCKMGGSCCGDHASCPMKKSGGNEAQTVKTANAIPTEDGTMSCRKSKTQAAAAGEHKDCCGSGASCCAGGGGACCQTKKMSHGL